MNPSDFSGVNFCTTSGALTATGAVTTHDTTVTINFCVNGKAFTKTAITTGATPTTDGVTGAAFNNLTASEGCIFVWGLLAAGTLVVVQGEITDLDASGNFKDAPEFPGLPDTICPFAYMVAKAGSTAGTVTFGTSNWNATGFTNVIVNLLTMPNRPQVA